jgi:hypothetical protein
MLKRLQRREVYKFLAPQRPKPWKICSWGIKQGFWRMLQQGTRRQNRRVAEDADVNVQEALSEPDQGAPKSQRGGEREVRNERLENERLKNENRQDQAPEAVQPRDDEHLL